MNWLQPLFALLGKLLDLIRSRPAPAPVPAGPPAAPGPASARYLGAKQMREVAAFKGTYEWALETVGLDIPWQAMAAIHYRESSFAKRGEEVYCGPFAYDPEVPPGSTLAKTIAQHVLETVAKYSLPASFNVLLDDNMFTASLIAADELKKKMRPEKGEDALADALWGYNGRSKFHTADGTPSPAGCSWRWSPYVSNDPLRGVCLRLRGTVPDPTVPGGRRRIDIEDARPGALAILRELTERAAELA